MNKFKKLVLGFVTVGLLFAASNSTRRSSAQKTLPEGLLSVPTGLTEITAKESVVFQVVVTNNTGGAITFLLQDEQGSPLVLIPTISVAANTAIVVPFPEGVRMLKGMKWQAGGTGLSSEIYGFVSN